MTDEAAPLGRPPDFLEKARFMVLLERRELHQLQLHATRVGMSASAFARAAIVAAVNAKRRPRPLPRPDRRIAR